MTTRVQRLPRPSLPDAPAFASEKVEDAKGILVRVDSSVRKELKLLAVNSDRTVQSLMLEAIDLVLARYRDHSSAER